MPFCRLLLLLLPLSLGAPSAAAFTFSDGTTAACFARGEEVPEKFAAPGDVTMQNRTGLAARVDGRWQITWNANRLKLLPPDIYDFLFFHECAHAQVPTEVEFDANCAGLIEMRAAGRATPEYEARMRRIYGNEPYWMDTFKCADIYAERRRDAKPAAPK